MKKLYSFLFTLILIISLFSQSAKGISDFAGGTGTLADPFLVSTPAQLNNVRNYSSAYAPVVYKYFKQINDIDLAPYLAIGGAGYTAWGSEGWFPIGAETTNSPFNGYYDGDNHIITGLTTNGRNEFSGLFGYFWWDSVIKNLGIESNGSVSGVASWSVGGLIGLNCGSIINCFSKVTVNGTGTYNRAGGLVGFNYGTITDSYSTGNVSGSSSTGGLVGVGYSNSKIDRSFAIGVIQSVNGDAGGIVGYDIGTSITNCYTKGSVTGKTNIGGIVGYGTISTKITNSYATGFITGTGNKGGLSGCSITPVESYWDKETTGQTTSYSSDPSYGKTTAEMKTQSTFSNWNFSSTWKISGAENNGYPTLRNPYIADVAPTTQASTVVFSDIQTTQMTISWTNGNGAKRAVFVVEGEEPLPTPSDNTIYTASTDWASKGSQIGTSKYYCIYNGSGNSVTLTGLTANTWYAAIVFEYNDVAGSEKYNSSKTATDNPKSQITATPCINPTDGGTITADQTGCAPFDPALLANSTLPTGHTGTLEYKWQLSTTSSTTDFADIATSNAATFNPSSITVTTWYKRIARVACQSDWTGAVESNVVKMTVDPVSVGGSITGGDSPIIYGSSTGTISLGGNTGTIVNWQKMVGTGSWVDFANTNATYSESPTSVGTWQYRAYVKSGTCAEVHSNPLSIIVSPKALTITGVTADTKSYDGNNTAILSGGAVSAAGVNAETLTFTAGTGTFADQNVGSKAVTAIGYALADGTNGGLATNYSLSAQPIVADQSITAKELTIGGSFTVNSKTYDGTTDATIASNGLTLLTKIGGDDVTLSAVAVFTNKNVGASKGNPYSQIIRLTGSSLAGDNALNYTLSLASSPTTFANLTAKALTITGVTAVSKEYDGLNTAILSGGAVTTGVGSETLGITAGTGTFANKNVGSKVVTALGYALANGTNGGLATNYSLLAQPTVADQTITAKSVSITGVSTTTKVYDGNNNATLSGGSVTTGVGSETLAITLGSGTFADKNVGSKVVTAIGYALTDGTNSGLASNYLLSAQPTIADQTITAKSVSITGVSASTKVYDGNNNATLSGGAVSTGVGSETLTFTAGIGTFADKSVGSKAVTAIGYALADGMNGGLAANYLLSAQPTVPNQTITTRPLEITATSGQSKIFGDTDPVFAYTITSGSLISGDAISGELTRAAGESVGSYTIQIGTLSAGTNYSISFVAADFSITPSTNVDPNDLNKIKIYSNSKDIFVIIPVLEGSAQLGLYNIIGNRVYSTVSLTQGVNRIEGRFITGTYIVKLMVGNKVLTQKVILNR